MTGAAARTAAIISIGDELTLGQNVDTNSAWLSAQLAELAVLAVEHRTVADDRQAIAAAIGDLAGTVSILLITGGLGPTQDDLTRLALGDAINPGRELVTDAVALEHIRRRFARRGRPMPPANAVQAQRPPSMRFLPNPNGTAPGLAGTLGRCSIFSLPGPPKEMQPMFRDHVAPALRESAGHEGAVIRTLAIHEYGMGESDAEQRLGDLTSRVRHPLVGLTVKEGIVSARIRYEGPPGQANAMIEETASQVEACWAPYVFGRADDALAASLGRLLRSRGLWLATAESCTGGLLGAMIVSVPGSSAYYRGGWITYIDQMKTSQLGVGDDVLKANGAVSAPVAAAMAQGALRAGAADVALAITGVAGPDGGSDLKPVGTVCIAMARKNADPIVRRFAFAGDRQQIRDRSACAALQMARFALLDVPADQPLIWESREAVL